MPSLTQDEIVRCRRAFKRLDHDNDGTIQVYELRHSLQDLCPPEHVDAIIDFADADRNGRIDFSEFLRVASQDIRTASSSPSKSLGKSQDKSKSDLETRIPPLKDILPQTFEKNNSHSNGNQLPTSENDETEISNNTAKKRKQSHRCCYCIFLIHPESRFASFWQAATAIAIAYAALMTPVLLAFEDQFFGESKRLVLSVDTGVNTIFIVDIFINFCSMYVDDKGDLVFNGKAIAYRYLSTWFFPDLVSCIPLNFILGSEDSGGLLYAKLARMGKFARVLKMLKILKVLKLFRLIKFIAHFDRIFQSALSNNKYETSGSKMYQFMKFCICALLVAHVAGCLWYALARFHENVEDTWITKRDIEDADIIDQYLASMYFIMTTLTTVGYGDISASTNAEIVVAILLMIGGVLGYSISVGTVSTVLMEADQRQTVIANKMQTLAYFAKDTNMDFMEYGKIKKHIKHKYTESLDWMHHLSGPGQLQSLLNDLPVVLRAKMLRHMHHGKHLNLEFFSRYRDDDLFLFIVPLLSSAHFHVNELVYIKGDYAERMYFLTRGTVVYFVFESLEQEQLQRATSNHRQFMDSEEYREVEDAMKACDPFQIVVDGSTFGDFELLLGIPRQECVRCDSYSECLGLHKKDLLPTLAEFPLIAESMRRDAQQEFMRTMKRKLEYTRSKGMQSSLSQELSELLDRYGIAGSLYQDEIVLQNGDEIVENDTSESHDQNDETVQTTARWPCSDFQHIEDNSDSVPRIPATHDHVTDIAGEHRESDRVPYSQSTGGGKNRENDAVPPCQSSGGCHAPMASAYRFQIVENRLDSIEKKQDSMMSQLQQLQTTLFSIDLRMQSLVLRN